MTSAGPRDGGASERWEDAAEPSDDTGERRMIVSEPSEDTGER